MAKKQSPKEYPPEKCLYCAGMTDSREYVINPGAKGGKELPCCSEACFEKTQSFVQWDNRRRPLFYIILFVLVLANLFFFGLAEASRWQFLPLMGIAVLVLAVPSVFTRYERYQALGIARTRKVIRGFAAALAVFAAVLLVVS